LGSRLHKLRTDRGSATVETVLAVPLIMLLLLIIVQLALAVHAQHIAQTAASRGLAAARAQDATAAMGEARATTSLRVLGGRVLTNPIVHVSRGAKNVTVRVRGDVLMVVPGLHLTVTGHADGPRERWTGR
jgi:Flp pilus assembly protein TadG